MDLKAKLSAAVNRAKIGPGDPPKKKANGTYFAASNGRVGRTTPTYENNVSMQSMDTTGYAAGKENFKLKNSQANYSPTYSNVKREDVLAKIKEMKSGATKKIKIN